MEFSKDSIRGTLYFSKDNRHCLIRGMITEKVKNKQISYIGAAPIHKNGSYSGSALPFPNQFIAFENTPNTDIVKLNNKNEFEFLIKTPGQYYTHLGSVLIPSRIYIQYNNDFLNKTVEINIGKEYPYRTLTYDKRHKDVMFYDNVRNLPIRSQEQILYDSGYPQNLESKTFWNLKPSL